MNSPPVDSSLSAASDFDNQPTLAPFLPPALWFIIFITRRPVSLLRTPDPSETEQIPAVAGWWIIGVARGEEEMDSLMGKATFRRRRRLGGCALWWCWTHDLVDEAESDGQPWAV